jgi:hypothetical protein
MMIGHAIHVIHAAAPVAGDVGTIAGAAGTLAASVVGAWGWLRARFHRRRAEDAELQTTIARSSRDEWKKKYERERSNSVELERKLYAQTIKPGFSNN